MSDWPNTDMPAHGSGFCSEFGPGHFRTITLPRVEILAEAYDKLEKFMIRHKA